MSLENAVKMKRMNGLLARSLRICAGFSRFLCLAFVVSGLVFTVLPSRLLAQQADAPAASQADDVAELQVLASLEDGYGRVILTFEGRNLLPDFSIKQDNSIFVVRFDERAQSNSVTALPRILPDYISIARLDPDGKGIRIAFKDNVRINTMEAGERLFIDFLPKDWKGLPPSLPAEVVADLAKRAEEALRLARSLEQADAGSRIQPELDIRIGDHPTFSRFAFEWNIPFDSTFERKGKEVYLYFNHKTDVDLSRIRASLPPLVHDMRMNMENGRAKFTLLVSGNADVRAFREKNSYIVDITGDKELFEAKGAEEQITRAVSRPGDTGMLIAKGTPLIEDRAQGGVAGVGDRVGGSKSVNQLVLGPGPGQSDAVTAPLRTDLQPAPALTPSQASDATTAPMPKLRPVSDATNQALQPTAQGNEPPSVVTPPVSVSTEPANTQKGATPPTTVSQPASVVATVPSTQVQPSVPTGGNAEQMKGMGPDLSSQSLRVEAKKFGRSVRLYFPFKSPTAAAVFRKNGVIWGVFDTSLDLDVAAVRQHLADISDDIDVWRSGNTSVIRVPLKNSRLATFSAEGYGWLLTIGEMVVEPTKPLHLARTKLSGGRSAMRVRFDNAGSILRLRDPGTGETLHVITGFGPARGFVKGQRLVDFTTLVSAHGIALTEHVDDLQVLRDEGFVYISSDRGLTISNTKGPAKNDVSSLLNDDGNGRETFLDLKSLAAKTPVIFSRQRQDLERKVSQFDDLMAIQSELALSKLLVANGYAFEALGHLQIIEKSAPEFARGRGFRTLYSAAEVMAGRPDPAFRRLNHPEFESDPDASVWRGLAAARTGRWREAEDALDLANTVAQDYGEKVQQMMLLDRVEIGIIDQQFGSAFTELAEVNPAYLDEEGVARYNLLRGKIAVARSKPDEAFEAFKASRDTGYLPIAHDAWLQEIKLQRQEGKLDVDKAIDELEGLTTIWRGDDVELNGLRTLAHLYVDKREYRNAFETLKSAADSDPASDISRILQEEMNAVFSSLFLDGKANDLSAIKALSLYYDFRELTPVGRRGDEMVRRLADKLVEVDLLDRAAELLNHQVENRLKGAARSQIAADLAVIYLLDSKPNLALDTLRRTRQSQLPLSLERQRRLVEAKALAELNKVNLALELLKPLEGRDVDQLRADILWRAKRWQDTAEQIELMLGERWGATGELDKQEQTNILRAGIAYSLADDALGLDRLRRKYATKMANSSVAGAFDVVTLPIERNAQEFQTIAQEIAGIDTMERFLEEYRDRYLSGDLDQKKEAASNPADNQDNSQV